MSNLNTQWATIIKMMQVEGRTGSVLDNIIQINMFMRVHAITLQRAYSLHYTMVPSTVACVILGKLASNSN